MKLGGRVISRLEDVLAFENQVLRDLEEIKAGRCIRRGHCQKNPAQSIVLDAQEISKAKGHSMRSPSFEQFRSTGSQC